MVLNKDKFALKNNKDQIKELINTLLKLYPENTDVKTVAYDFYNGIGEQISAYELIKKIIKEKKDTYIIWQQALYNASSLEKYDDIISIGEEAFKYFPNKAELFLLVGMAYYQKQNFETSYKTLKDGLNFVNELGDNKLQYLILLAESSYKTGKKMEAFSYYEELLKLDPENNIIKNNYSYFLALEGINLERAKQLSAQTIKKDPENSTYLDTYGWILFVIGNYEEAKVYIQKAIKINEEKDPDILFHYAEILFKTGDKAQSRKYYLLAEASGFDKDIIQKKLLNFPGDE